MLKIRRPALIVPLMALAAALVLTPARAQVVKPFKITGSGVGPEGLPVPGQPTRPHWIVGEATHLGRHYGEGTVQTLSIDPVSPPGTITGRFGRGIPAAYSWQGEGSLTFRRGR
ncbi:hypothetical protein [Tautonia plasticadhaerens]|uniref:Uncharacterized protein n=1 Tax=Tautonia plasticadhaerens TaxID=2527974 RepID=A0A518HFA4_9BACT|nr:hypothetical protein [Tautonia plasticadhaerens]QDV39498.1 hypothetical protein ElP_74660 [Tautonia plasticadhaerens]